MIDTLRLTAEDAAGLLASGDVAGDELAAAYVEAIGERDPELHAYLHVVGEAATGVPIALKDNITTRGVPTTAGSRILEGYVPVFDSTVATRVKAAGLPLRQGWIVLLAWGASPPLLSFALAGQAYASGYFPHALALWVTLDRRFERRLLLTLLLSLFACAFSWYLYDTARTVFAVFLGAAVLRWDARWPARAWAAMSRRTAESRPPEKATAMRVSR